MGESASAVVAFLTIVTTFVAIVMLVDLGGRPDPGLRVPGIASAALAVAGFIVLIWTNFRRDLVPDFLRSISLRFFERDGFCFLPQVIVRRGIPHVRVWYQNRYEKACEAMVVLCPGKTFLMGSQAGITARIHLRCPGGGFGVAEVPVELPVAGAGNVVIHEVGAQVRYPDGGGRLLRFRAGERVGEPQMSALDIGLTVAAAAVGHLLIRSPAKLKLQLPQAASLPLPADPPAAAEVLWQPGRPTEGVAPRLAEVLRGEC